MTTHPYAYWSREKFSLPEIEARRLFSKPICAKEERNGPPSANQGFSVAKPRHSYAVFTPWMDWPTSPYPNLSTHAALFS